MRCRLLTALACLALAALAGGAAAGVGCHGVVAPYGPPPVVTTPIFEPPVYAGYEHFHWEYFAWSKKFGCRCYFCPKARVWYYWHTDHAKFYPLDTIATTPPPPLPVPGDAPVRPVPFTRDQGILTLRIVLSSQCSAAAEIP